MGKYLDRHNFTADEPMETHSVSLDPRDTQVKTTVKGQHTPVRTSELKRLLLLQRGQGMRGHWSSGSWALPRRPGSET